MLLKELLKQYDLDLDLPDFILEIEISSKYSKSELYVKDETFMEFKVKHSHYWGDVLVATLISTLTIDFNSEYIVQDTFTNENNPRSFGGTAYTLDGAIDILN